MCRDVCTIIIGAYARISYAGVCRSGYVFKRINVSLTYIYAHLFIYMRAYTCVIFVYICLYANRVEAPGGKAAK